MVRKACFECSFSGCTAGSRCTYHMAYNGLQINVRGVDGIVLSHDGGRNISVVGYRISRSLWLETETC